MKRKLREYFRAGVRLVWLIDPPTRTAEVYQGPEKPTRVPSDGVLVGEDVLPGFELPMGELFARAELPSRFPKLCCCGSYDENT